MKKFDWKKIVFLFLSFCFLAVIRLHWYDRVPGSSHAEELLYGWSGIHLVETGTPVSWSTLDYPEENLVFDGLVGDPEWIYLPAKLYKPWLDEPPVYSWIVGMISHAYGDDRNAVLPTSHTRIPVMIAGLVTLAMVFVVGKEFFGYFVGWLAMVVYGVTPIFVFGSRLSIPENIMVMGVMIMLWAARRYEIKDNRWFAWLVGVMGAILGLMKPTGYFVIFLGMFLVARKKKWRDVLVMFLWFVLGVGAFVLYGYLMDWEVFLRIVAIQGIRFAGWTGLGYILTSPSYDIFMQYDGWYIFCLVMSLFYILQKKKSREMWLLSMFFVYWLLVAVFGGTEQDLLPWYRYPMFPVMAVFGGLGLKKIWDEAEFIGTSLVVGLLLSARYFLHNAFRPTTPPNVFRGVYFLAVVPSLAHMVWPKKWLKVLARGVLIILFVLGVWFNAKYIYSVFEIACESITCPFGESTLLSRVKFPFFWRLLVPKDSTGMLDVNRPWF